MDQLSISVKPCFILECVVAPVEKTVYLFVICKPVLTLVDYWSRHLNDINWCMYNVTVWFNESFIPGVFIKITVTVLNCDLNLNSKIPLHSFRRYFENETFFRI